RACSFLTSRRLASTSSRGPTSSVMCATLSPRKECRSCGRRISSMRSRTRTMSSCCIKAGFSRMVRSRPWCGPWARQICARRSLDSRRRPRYKPRATRHDRRDGDPRSAHRLLAAPIRDLPQGHCLAGGTALSASARTVRGRGGPPAGLAVHFRHGLSASARCIDHSTLRNLCAVRGLHHARTDITYPALQRDAVLALDGLRSRDGQHAHPAREPAAAVVPALVKACRRHDRVVAASLHISRDCLVLGNRGTGHRLYCGVTRPGLVGSYAGRARDAHVICQQTTRELCRRDELCDLS